MNTTTDTQTWAEGWHFATVASDGKPRERYGARREIVVGERLAVDGTPAPCVCGMHASERALDALSYAINNGNGIIATRVVLDGAIAYQSDKAAATGRTVTAMLSVEMTDAVLRAVARRCALDVLPLWRDSAPETVIRYLETGDESIRAAAWSAAGDAAWDAARAAAGAAAWSAAGDAAWAAARTAAWAAAGAAKIDLYAGWLDAMLAEAMAEAVTP